MPAGLIWKNPPWINQKIRYFGELKIYTKWKNLVQRLSSLFSLVHSIRSFSLLWKSLRLKDILLVSQSLLKISQKCKHNFQLTSYYWFPPEFVWVNKTFSAGWFKFIAGVSSSAVYHVIIDWLELQTNWLPCQTGTLLKLSRSSTVPVHNEKNNSG